MSSLRRVEFIGTIPTGAFTLQYVKLTTVRKWLHMVRQAALCVVQDTGGYPIMTANMRDVLQTAAEPQPPSPLSRVFETSTVLSIEPWTMSIKMSAKLLLSYGWAHCHPHAGGKS
mmetsp:Transcript_42453/g.66466  ORF Transcript_42453/g.66466 Transcript_42453/m.66466 type:complete len:115 (-) Transcript_42453:432-776(-)